MRVSAVGGKGRDQEGGVAPHGGRRHPAVEATIRAPRVARARAPTAAAVAAAATRLGDRRPRVRPLRCRGAICLWRPARGHPHGARAAAVNTNLRSLPAGAPPPPAPKRHTIRAPQTGGPPASTQTSSTHRGGGGDRQDRKKTSRRFTPRRGSTHSPAHTTPPHPTQHHPAPPHLPPPPPASQQQTHLGSCNAAGSWGREPPPPAAPTHKDRHTRPCSGHTRT